VASRCADTRRVERGWHDDWVQSLRELVGGGLAFDLLLLGVALPVWKYVYIDWKVEY
jgi:hypothetical protein